MGRAGRSGGGSSGGGRSFGGGGSSRGFGGRSSGSGRSGGSGLGRSGNSGRSSLGLGGGFGRGRSSLGGGYRPNRNIFIGGNSFGGGSNNGGYNNGNHSPRLGGAGCLMIFVVAVVVMFFASVMWARVGGFGDNHSITTSTREREPLEAGAVNETAYYRDDLGWIGNKTELERGLKKFYEETGVQPYLIITDNVNGENKPTSAEVQTYLEIEYDTLFTDEGHLLYLFMEYNESYSMWYLTGHQAKTVLDAEAMDILMDYVDRYYYSELEEEEMFATAFAYTGERIMKVTPSTLETIVPMVAIVFILLLSFSWWKKRKAQKNLEAEQTREILSMPLEAFGDTEAEALAKKYEDDKQ